MTILTLGRKAKQQAAGMTLDDEVCLVVMLSMAIHGNYRSVKAAVKRFAATQVLLKDRDHIYEEWVHVDDVYAKAKAHRPCLANERRSGGLVERAAAG